MDFMGEPRLEHMGEVLDRINEIEIESEHPKLSAVVANRTGRVSGGFCGSPRTPPSMMRVTREEQLNRTLTPEEESH